jgi:hypothetical protein
MKKYHLQYNRSIFWLVFFAIVCLPIAIVLLATGFEFQKEETLYKIHYEGSTFWLGFWAVVFFPIAIIMSICKGFSVTPISRSL